MGKEVLVVVLCSIFIILAFLASLYLMHTVNPDPLPDIKQSQDIEPVEIHETDAAHLMGAEPEKMDVDATDFYTSKRPGSYPNRDRKVVSPIWPRRYQEKIVTPTVSKVVPPIWPTNSVPITIDVTRSTKRVQYEVSTAKEISSSNKSDVKSRKSRSNYRSHEDLGSIILKLLSNTGKPRIEIKLHPKGCLKKKKAKGNKYTKSELVFAAKPENNNYVDTNSQIANHTVINVCGNDSIVIDDSGELEILQLIELIKSISAEAMKNNTKNLIKENMTVLPLNKNASDEILVHNQIKSFNNITENNSTINFNISNVNDINDARTTESIKGDSNNVAVTHLDNIHNTKIIVGVKNREIETLPNSLKNNKEFNKMVFDEEEIDSINKTSHAPDNVTILISDIIQSNITDLYIENDSDIIY